MPDVKTELEVLRTELESDLAQCTTRDQHIRLSLRLSRLDTLISSLATEGQVAVTEG